MKYIKVCPRGFANEYIIYAIPDDKMPEFKEEYGDLENQEGNSGYTVIYKNPAQWVINSAVPWNDRNF